MSKNEVFIDEDAIKKIATICRRISIDQIRQAVYLCLTTRHGCRRIGKAVKPPISKDTARKIIKLYEKFTKHLEEQERDEVWEGIKERLAEEMRVKTLRGRMARLEAQKLADCKTFIRLRLENRGNRFVLRSMELCPEAYEAYHRLLMYCKIEDMDPSEALSLLECDAKRLMELVEGMTAFEKPELWVAKTAIRLLDSELPSIYELKTQDFMRRYGPFRCPKGHLISRYDVSLKGVLPRHQRVNLTDRLVWCRICAALYIVACPRCGSPMKAFVSPDDTLDLSTVQQYRCPRCGTFWRKHQDQTWPQVPTRPAKIGILGIEVTVTMLQTFLDV